MQKQTLCFLVIGASVGILLQALAKRRVTAETSPAAPGPSAEVIDLAAWKEMRRQGELAI